MMTLDELLKESYEFVRGYYDCKYAVKHKASLGFEYEQGYNTRYQEEQIEGAKS